MEEEGDIPSSNVYILPPAEEGNESGIDSDVSDEEHTGDVNHLPHRNLRQSFELAPLDNDYDFLNWAKIII